MSTSYGEAKEESPVPVVDFGPFINGSEADKKDVASKIDEAFRTVGFVYLINHSVTLEKVEECFKWVNFLHLIHQTIC